jgi:hypothetical protein
MRFLEKLAIANLTIGTAGVGFYSWLIVDGFMVLISSLFLFLMLVVVFHSATVLILWWYRSRKL